MHAGWFECETFPHRFIYLDIRSSIGGAILEDCRTFRRWYFAGVSGSLGSSRQVLQPGPFPMGSL